ncbi:hypothetical protein CC78DRAFT_544066 [Lojkania enalia]|uniref:Uncharacterized protein n=1 Tax=Lojkania enalia TaxID=147567 RepID=A0A9P4KBD0_9PLEO|nr:hypothetical protein CC78DRAFT_544066 [Didymosphaeria enalia]
MACETQNGGLHLRLVSDPSTQLVFPATDYSSHHTLFLSDKAPQPPQAHAAGNESQQMALSRGVVTSSWKHETNRRLDLDNDLVSGHCCAPLSGNDDNQPYAAHCMEACVEEQIAILFLIPAWEWAVDGGDAGVARSASELAEPDAPAGRKRDAIDSAVAAILRGWFCDTCPLFPKLLVLLFKSHN